MSHYVYISDSYTRSVASKIFNCKASLQHFDFQGLSLDRPSHIVNALIQSFCSLHVAIRGLSGKYENTVNTQAKTFNNNDLFLFVSLRTI